MKIIVREVTIEDQETFIELSLRLSQFNRINHASICKYDDYMLVYEAVRQQAELTFSLNKQDVKIFIAELDGVPAGYVLAKIYDEAKTAENGTGTIGLLDELFVDETVRGNGIGRQLMNCAVSWMKTRKITRIKLHAYTWNSQAIRLYEKLGFCKYAESFEKFLAH